MYSCHKLCTHSHKILVINQKHKWVFFLNIVYNGDKHRSCTCWIAESTRVLVLRRLNWLNGCLNRRPRDLLRLHSLRLRLHLVPIDMLPRCTTGRSMGRCRRTAGCPWCRGTACTRYQYRTDGEPVVGILTDELLCLKVIYVLSCTFGRRG